MADFLGGLLSGGGGLYDDLLTPQQRDQLSSRGLLSMAGAFADAAMPSRLPIPLGAALGKAAAAMSGGRDEAALRLLQGQKLSQEVQTMKATTALQQQFMKDIQTLPLDVLFKRYGIGAGGGAPAAAGATTSPLPAAPAAAPTAAPTTLPLPPAAAALPGTPAASAALFGGDSAAGEYGVGQYDVGKDIPPPATRAAALPLQNSPPTAAERLEWNKTVGTGGLDVPLEDWVAQHRAGAPTGLLGPAPSLPPGDVPPPEPPLKASSLGAPDTVLPRGPGGLLATPALYGGGAGTPPFSPDGEPTVRLAASSGGVPDAGRQARVDFWQSQGAPAHVAQGIADRVKAESSFNPSAMGDSNTSGGLYQHHADRLTRLKTFAAGQGKAWTDPNVQDQFAAGEVRGGDAIAAKHWPEIMAAPTREAAATLWDRYFERSKYGPGAGGGRAPDEVIRSGGGVPGFTRAQYSGAAPGAPGAPDGQGMNTLLLELAKRNAMAEILKLGNPYSSMLSVLQGSPEYKGQIAGAEEGAKQPFALERQRTQNELDIAKDLIGKGVARMPDGSIVPIPNAAAAFAAIDNARQTGDIKEYQAYAGQEKALGGIPKSFEQWDLQRRRAAATSINTAEGIEAAQMKARMAVDQKVAGDAADKALAAQQLMPLLDEALHLARTTPGGLAGPVSQKFAGIASALGIAVPAGASNAEALGSINQQLIPLVRQPGAQSNAEMDAYLRAGPGLMLSQDGRVKIAEMTKAMSQRAIEVARVYRANIGAPDLYEKLAALDKPLFTAEQRAAMAAATNAPAAAAPQGAVAPGTFQTPHGTVTRVPN